METDNAKDISFYNSELKDRVEDVFRCASRLNEIRSLICCVKDEAQNLRFIFLTAEEQNVNSDAANAFDMKIQKMYYSAYTNLENYQLAGWKEFFEDGEQ